MNIEFHYHITYLLARKGGFSVQDASKIAYACQFTDDNNDIYRVQLDDGNFYRNYISQTLDIRRPKNKLIRIYSCFHFFPGQYKHKNARRRDCALHLFNTTPDSPKARDMFLAALNSGDLYRIGIATHCYSDTWAHQNFVGLRHSFGDGKGLLVKAKPTIGHVDFTHRPDIPNHEWLDHRLLEQNENVSNKKRFLLAAKSIFTAFAQHNDLEHNIQKTWSELEQQLSHAIGETCSNLKQCKKGKIGRIKAYRNICPEMPEYDRKAWQVEAMRPIAGHTQRKIDLFWQRIPPLLKAYLPTRCRIRLFKANDNFFKTDWHFFQEGVKAHQKYVMGLHNDRYQQIGAPLQRIL